MAYIGKNLKRIRDLKNLSITELSELSGLSRNFIYELEHDKKAPTTKTLDKLKKALNVTDTELLEENQTENINNDYIEVLKTAQEKGIDPQKLRELIQLVDNIHKSDK